MNSTISELDFEVERAYVNLKEYHLKYKNKNTDTNNRNYCFAADYFVKVKTKLNRLKIKKGNIKDPVVKRFEKCPTFVPNHRSNAHTTCGEQSLISHFYIGGISAKKIAKKFGVTLPTVYSHVRKYTIELHPSDILENLDGKLMSLNDPILEPYEDLKKIINC
jgi:hypothetical protein